jgi:hypothetical protein
VPLAARHQTLTKAREIYKINSYLGFGTRAVPAVFGKSDLADIQRSIRWTAEVVIEVMAASNQADAAALVGRQ